MKKIICFLCAVVAAASLMNLSIFTTQDTFACSSNTTFLFFRNWSYNLESNGFWDSASCAPKVPESDSSNNNLSKFVWVIILNIVYDLFAVVGTLATGYIIFAGYEYMTSSGDPGKVAKAKKSLVAAVAGIILALSSNVLVSTIQSFIGTGNNNTAEGTLGGAFNLAYAVAGFIATGFIIFGGIQYTLSSGDAGKTRRGRQTLIYASIGLVVVLAAAAITNFVIGVME